MPRTKIGLVTSIPGETMKEILTDVPEELELVMLHKSASDEEKIARFKDMEYIVGAVASLSPDVFRACERLKFFQIWGAGFEYLPLELLGEKGVTVCNNGGTNAIAVAEVAIGLMLFVYRNLEKQWQAIDQRKWRQDLNPGMNRELTGKTVGIVGLGHIGKEVAQRLNQWAGRLLYYDVVDVPASTEKWLGVERVSLESLLKESDIVTLHVPYNKRTHHLIGERELAIMKPTAVLVNTCRGAVVDEPALIQALQSKTIAAAGLDVFEQEPVDPNNPLLKMPNVFALPHRAGASVDTFKRSADFGWENILRVMRGEQPLSQVWPPRARP